MSSLLFVASDIVSSKYVKMSKDIWYTCPKSLREWHGEHQASSTVQGARLDECYAPEMVWLLCAGEFASGYSGWLSSRTGPHRAPKVR